MTPIQELIKEIEESIKVYEDAAKKLQLLRFPELSYEKQRSADLLKHCKQLAESKLQAEREAIEKAYEADLYGGLSGHRKFEDGKDYYNQTFKTK